MLTHSPARHGATPRPFHPQSAICNPPFTPRSFTLIELLLVLVVIGITFFLVVPTPAESRDLKLREAARLLTADLEFAQNESIAHPDNPRLVKFDPSHHTWWVAAVSTPDTPVADPANPAAAMLVSPGTGRAAALSGVTIASLSLGGDSELRFNAYGVPDQSTAAAITLRCGTPTLTVQVAPGSGEVSIP